jgi:BirA family biotin operon repressor/biotin-[acetyl-CoA-carboxylase] ligase
MKDRILEELRKAYPGFVSGARLAQSLDISRVAVWKHIETLKQAGYDITAVKGKGYCLHNGGQAIIPSLLEKHLHNSPWGSPLYFATQTESTNRWARQLLDSEPLIPDGALVLAATQTGGRGRMGRKWSSPQGGLYFSLILRPNLDLQRASLLSLVLAVSCARSLQNYINYPCRVKWPNDVMIDGLKAGGILLEASGEMDRLAYVVAGIGLNVNQTLLDLPVEVRGLATSLIAVTGQNCDLNLLAAHLLKDLQQDYYSFLQEGFAPFLEAYKQFCIHLQQPISVNNGKDQIIGINKDIDENGNLLIEADGKLLSISTGDVQLIDFQGEQ